MEERGRQRGKERQREGYGQTRELDNSTGRPSNSRELGTHTLTHTQNSRETNLTLLSELQEDTKTAGYCQNTS